MAVALDFTMIVLGIFGADIALIGGSLLAVRPQVDKAMTKIPSKSFFSFGTPLDWLNNSLRFFTISFFASLAYLIMTTANIGVGTMPLGSDNMLFFSIIFLVIGVIFVIRTTEFIHSPYSDNNFNAAKITYWFIQIGLQVSLLVFVSITQILNLLLFYPLLQGLIHKLSIFSIVFNSSVVLSFIAMFPFVWAILFRLRENFTLRDFGILVCFFSPFIVLSVLGALIIMGFNLL
jgi:hypothetical protein